MISPLFLLEELKQSLVLKEQSKLENAYREAVEEDADFEITIADGLDDENEF